MTAGVASAAKLPELRQELSLIDASVDLAGNRLWKIYDPLRHRYLALSQKGYAMLEAWSETATVESVIATAWTRHAEVVTPDEVRDFSAFLVASGLASMAAHDAWRQSHAAAERQRSAYLTRLLHGYLFFRVPLARPERFLRATLPFVRVLASRAMAVVLLLMAVAGLYLVSREWDQFLAQASRLASWSGAAGVLLAVAAVKVLHELGHGYTAVHYGCRVPAAGVALILGAPLLFVDVTDGWRLRSRRARLVIDAAGIAVDLAVSIVATVAWVFLPDGIARNAAFSFATAGWLTSLAFNLNPFMKFDGYHLVADALSMPNLQERALALARWRLREIVFGLGLAPPERMAPGLRTILIVYGWSTWAYRVMLFTGIALAVYHYFFKALGIVLFLVEIGYFIVAPVWRELKAWSGMRAEIMSSRRTLISSGIALSVLMLLVVPWSTEVSVPSVLEPAHVARVHVPVPARIASIDIENGESVAAGTTLMTLVSDALDHELRIAKLKAAAIDVRLARLVSAASDREMATILSSERRALERTTEGLRERIAELRVRAPSSGTVSSLLQHAANGRWVTPSEPLAMLHGDGGARIRGLVEAADSTRVRQGMRARFIPNDPTLPSVPAVVSEVASANAAVIDQLELASSFGGPVPSQVNKSNKAVPLSAQYALTAAVDQNLGRSAGRLEQPQVGVLLVSGEAQSLIVRFWNRILTVLVRESGF